MTDAALSASDLDEIASGLAEVAAEFAGEVGSAPTLGEFLEVLGWAAPVNSDSTDETFAEPLKFKVTVKGNKQYRTEQASRVPELNDSVFEDARQQTVELVERMNRLTGEPVSPQQFASAILVIVNTGRIEFADIDGKDIRKLAVEMPKKRAAKPKPGDVLAIPAGAGGYRLAVVLTQNRFGTALGLFRGTSRHGRPDAAVLRTPCEHPVYTEDGLVKDGTWKVAGHDDGLRALFPADPPVYHRPGAWPGIDTGEYGAAETADGQLRLVGEDEARGIGLLDGTYRQTYPAAYLQKVLENGESCP